MPTRVKKIRLPAKMNYSRCPLFIIMVQGNLSGYKAFTYTKSISFYKSNGFLYPAFSYLLSTQWPDFMLSLSSVLFFSENLDDLYLWFGIITI